MSLREIREPLERWAAAGHACAVATLVRVRRSAPRRPGARFAVNDAGEAAGSISAGCVEGDLSERLRGILEGGPPAVLHYGITDEMAVDVGLSCGGEIDVLLARYRPDDPAWSALTAAIDAGEPAVLVTGLSESVRGRSLLLGGAEGVDPEAAEPTRAGSLGSAELDARGARAAAVRFQTGGTAVVRLDAGSARSEGRPALEAFAEAYLPARRLAIVGATPTAAALCRFAHRLGWAVTVIDPREALLDPEKFPDAETVLRAWPDEGLAEIGLDPYVAVVVLAHDRKLDLPALTAALRAGCLYVGLLGGSRTQRLRREALRESGFGEADLERIRGPVGLEIGAETPEEIAVSIAAELVSTRRGR